MTVTAMHHSHFERRLAHAHGFGVFTRVAIAGAQPVFTFGGPIVTFEQITPDMRVMQVGPDEYISEDVDADYIENYINHSCEPNLGFLDGSLTLSALRDIAAGEELTWDYSTSMNEEGWEMPCGCGTARCRRTVRSFHALTDEQRHALRPTALAYLRHGGR